MIYPPEAVTISEVPPPGRIYNAPLHPRPEIALVGADVLIRPLAARPLARLWVDVGIDPYMSGIS